MAIKKCPLARLIFDNTSNISETYVSQHNEDPIKRTPQTPQYHSVVISEGFQGALN